MDKDNTEGVEVDFLNQALAKITMRVNHFSLVEPVETEPRVEDLAVGGQITHQVQVGTTVVVEADIPVGAEAGIPVEMMREAEGVPTIQEPIN